VPFPPCIQSAHVARTTTESARRCGPGHTLGLELVEFLRGEPDLREHFTRVLAEKWCVAVRKSLRATGEPDRHSGSSVWPCGRATFPTGTPGSQGRSAISSTDLATPGRMMLITSDRRDVDDRAAVRRHLTRSLLCAGNVDAPCHHCLAALTVDIDKLVSAMIWRNFVIRVGVQRISSASPEGLAKRRFCRSLPIATIRLRDSPALRP
jgi:hypothetical protein